jgi:hypothetical protein
MPAQSMEAQYVSAEHLRIHIYEHIICKACGEPREMSTHIRCYYAAFDNVFTRTCPEFSLVQGTSA